MTRNKKTRSLLDLGLKKSPTGVRGLDEILYGGLPEGRITLVCGGPGSGKTLLATEFIVCGATQYGDPGVFMVFEEKAEDLTKNVASLGIDLQELVDQKKVFVDFVYVERSEIEETGEYDLEGLFIRLESAIQAIGAKRVVLDTIESIFAGFPNEAILRSEIRRLFRWLKERGITTIVTGERGDDSLTRYGLEEYVSDCVILLENRVQNRMASRLLRVVKYRGSHHGTDEYPFLIGDEGIWVEPITSIGLNHPAPDEFISTGIPELDDMFPDGGYFRGSSILITGTPGTGKTSVCASLVNAACQRGERSLYVAFEESSNQIIRNMHSIGVDLDQWDKKELLHFHAVRPTFYGVEMHLLLLEKIIDEYNPSVVVIDPLSNLISVGSGPEINFMLIRLMDYLKSRQITSVFTALMDERSSNVTLDLGISSLMDTWVHLRNLEFGAERTRGLYIIKSRGQPHSNLVREFILTDQGIKLVDVFVGPDGILLGSSRKTQEVRERLIAEKQNREAESRHQQLIRQREILQIQIDSLQDELSSDLTGGNLDLSANPVGENALEGKTRLQQKPRKPKNSPGSREG